MTATAVFVLRRKHPFADRPYKALGYPVVPAVFVLVAAYLLVNTFVATPGRALAGFGLVVAGLPVYWYFARTAPAHGHVWLGDRDRP